EKRLMEPLLFRVPLHIPGHSPCPTRCTQPLEKEAHPSRTNRAALQSPYATRHFATPQSICSQDISRNTAIARNVTERRPGGAELIQWTNSLVHCMLEIDAGRPG